jgi:hypothetical protein
MRCYHIRPNNETNVKPRNTGNESGIYENAPFRLDEEITVFSYHKSCAQRCITKGFPDIKKCSQPQFPDQYQHHGYTRTAIEYLTKCYHETARIINRTLNSCWNLIYRRIFGFNLWESVKLFICGLGRLNLCHLLWVRRTNFYRHLSTVKSDRLRMLYRNFCTHFYNVDVCLKLVQLSNCRAQDYIRADHQRSASF